ncbi:aminoglycoside/hydroxyurea antibiotic resistance kinase [Lentzea tibetensis]|uniref:Aminoglycoside/hydroxyurea antibiotic resistance kinase n=1 Tax=Lentzea tibetensis TaxID=2591470 RepID=A0A563EPF3_9PSEU|nr:aminoglycoside phosphotransferase family protein [Lentzea tibetensis]TWP49273.1 aminoglycoside/hydroxyurea antibiotic resistance kinase [Lentzea tibetensis]
MITVPDGFGEGLGEGAPKWVASLPRLATKICARWRLTPDGELMNGFCAVVLPVRQADGHPAVLKLTWIDEETEHEALALKLWDGKGVVRLLDHDPELGALLLERLDHSYSLHDAPIEEAIDVVGGLIRTLRIPAPAEVRRVEPEIADHPAVPAKLLDAAREIGEELVKSQGDTLVNEDLHYENVLRGGREPWLMIDPKPVSGDPEWAVIPLLWNRFSELDSERGLSDRFAAICAAGDLDPERALGWTLHRAVSNWIWCLEEDPEAEDVLEKIARWAART